MSKSDTGSRTRDELEQLLPDLLYGELDEAESSAVRSQIDEIDELASKVQELSALRQAFGTLPDEEPPPAISAQLMHAAAAHVKKPGTAAASAVAGAEAGGLLAALSRWLQSLFRPLVTHPAAAAMASLVLVAGVAGLLYSRGADPSTHSTVTAPESPAVDNKLRGGEREEQRDEKPAAQPTATRGLRAAPAAVERGESKSDRASRREPDALDQPSGAISDSLDDRLGASKETQAKPKRRSNNKKRAPDTGKSAGSVSGGVEGGASGGTLGGVASGGTKAPAKSSADSAGDNAYEAELDEDNAAPASEESVPQQVANKAAKPEPAPPPEPSSTAKSLHRKAAAAATNGDCKQAGSLAAKLRSLDSGYYRDVFLRDSRIKNCSNISGVKP